jgi:hypothetical protein
MLRQAVPSRAQVSHVVSQCRHFGTIAPDLRVFGLITVEHDSAMVLSTAHSWQYNGHFVAEESAECGTRRPSVYLDTSIASYLTARLNSNLSVARHQRLTRVWWNRYRHSHTLFVSDLVMSEAAAGDSTAAAARLEALAGIVELVLDTRAESLAEELIGGGLLPPGARADAEHVAIAAINAAQVLLTWNCTHLANATIYRAVARTCEVRGFRCPEICTPEQLMRTYAHAKSTS